jgi:hypothetical protein
VVAVAAAAAAAKAAEAAGGKPDVAAPGFSLFVYRTSVARGFDFAQFVKTTRARWVTLELAG